MLALCVSKVLIICYTSNLFLIKFKIWTKKVFGEIFVKNVFGEKNPIEDLSSIPI
jgi:hypothetical protein